MSWHQRWHRFWFRPVFSWGDAHLEAVTQAENNRRSWEARK